MGLLDFLFPPICPHCGTPVVTQGEWCESCITDILHVRQVPEKFLQSLDCVYILSDYRGGMKSIIYDVKFNEKKEQSKGTAPFLASYNFYIHQFKPHYIIPVPSSKEKKKIRGYNQVDLFFKDWALSLECESGKGQYYRWLDCLAKIDTRKEMWALSGTERLETVKHAFMWQDDYKDIDFTDTRILLVDDIYTTGATLEASSRVLRTRSPFRIEGLTLTSGSF